MFSSTSRGADPPATEEFKQIQELLKPKVLPKAARALLPYVLSGDVMGNKKRGKRGGKRGKAVKGIDGKTWNTTADAPPFVRSIPPNNHVFTVQQLVEVGTVMTTSTSVPTFGVYYFVLSSLPQQATVTALFDQYRVDKLEAWVTPISQLGNDGTNSRWSSVIDLDDETLLTTYNGALEYETCTTTQICDAHYRTWVPGVAIASYSGAFTSYANVIAPWIDCGSTSVRHYGLKFAAEVASTAAHGITMLLRAHVSFRNVR